MHDATLTNGRYELPPHARGVISVPIEHRGEPAKVPIVVRSQAPKSHRFTSLFRRAANFAVPSQIERACWRREPQERFR